LGRKILQLPSEFKGRWGLVLTCAVGFGLGLSGLPFYTTGVFVEPLERAFGWSAAQIQGGLTLMLLTNLVSLPAATRLSQRIGPRNLALVSVCAFSAAFMSLAGLGGNLAGYYARWVLVSLAGAGTLGVVWSEVLSRRFVLARGTALGIAMMGSGVTGFFAPVLAQTLIHGVGWRAAFLLLGALPLLVAGPLVWTFFRTGEQDHPAPSTDRTRAPPAIRFDRRFCTIGAAFLLIGCAVAGVIPNFVKLMRSDGLSGGAAAGMASLAGLFVIVGRAACGVLLDRLWAPGVAAAFFAFAGAACLLLAVHGLSSVGLIVGAAAIGLAAGVELDVLPYLTGRYFGVQRMGMTLAVLSGCFYLGSALGPLTVATVADRLGGYAWPLRGAALFLAMGGALLLTLGRYPDPGQSPKAYPA